MTVCGMRFVRVSLSRRYIRRISLPLRSQPLSLDRSRQFLLRLLSFCLSSHLGNLSSRHAGPCVRRKGTQTRVCPSVHERRPSFYQTQDTLLSLAFKHSLNFFEYFILYIILLYKFYYIKKKILTMCLSSNIHSNKFYSITPLYVWDRLC